jgi:hypothetical protein
MMWGKIKMAEKKGLYNKYDNSTNFKGNGIEWFHLHLTSDPVARKCALIYAILVNDDKLYSDLKELYKNNNWEE